MEKLWYQVSPEIFDSFPGYVRGVVLADGVVNGPSPVEITSLLREAEGLVRQRLKLEELADHARIKPWREAYRSFGAKPSEYRSSIEALCRRVLSGKEIPSINALVDIGNIISLRHLVSAGGHALDDVTGDLALRPAAGTETFIPFGGEQMEHPEPGEIVFVEGDTVLTRRWTWRQANHTSTRLDTQSIEFNIDGLPPVTAGEIEVIGGELAELVEQFCKGRTRQELLKVDRPAIRLWEY
jgi:DNA/RNA-binding domain of Phe-tRNA-synthetase-like protein